MTITTFRVGTLTPRWGVDMLVNRVSALSGETMFTAVAAASGGVPVNPTGLDVSFAFLDSGVDPESGDWSAGTWDTTLIGTYVAGVQPAAGGVGLAPGEWYAWIKLEDETDVLLVRQFGTLIVE